MFNRCNLVAPIFGLGLNDADCTAIYEENVVDRPDVGRVFAYGDAPPNTEVNLVFVLNMPAGLRQLCVHPVTCNLFRLLVN